MSCEINTAILQLSLTGTDRQLINSFHQKVLGFSRDQGPCEDCLHELVDQLEARIAELAIEEIGDDGERGKGGD